MININGNNKENNFKNKNIPTKYKLLLIIKLNALNKEEKSLNYLLNDFQDVQNILSILNNEEINIPKFIYNNINNIHQILYNEEEVINLNFLKIKPELNNYFYLYQLISKSLEIVNYTYSIDFIKEINSKNINDIKKIRKLVFNLIILILIKNFEGLDEYDEEEQGEEIQKIKEENINSFKENISILKELNISLNINNIYNNNINDIYSNILNELIKQKKFGDYDYVYNIIDELDLEKIDITEKIYNNLSNILNDSNEDIQYYKIKEKQDLFNEEKINFYYILFKYILKDNIYIYKLKFLKNARKIIIKLLKKNELTYDEINNKNKKIKYIINFLIDTDFYLPKKEIPKDDKIKLNEVLKYFQNIFFESKKNVINEIKDILNKNIFDYKDYKIFLDFYNEAETMNNKFPLIKYYHNLINKNEENNIYTEKEFDDSITKWKNIEKLLKDKKLNKMRKKDKEDLCKIFDDINNKELLLKVFNQDVIDYFNNEIKNKKKKQGQKNEKQNNNNNYIIETRLPPVEEKEKPKNEKEKSIINQNNIIEDINEESTKNKTSIKNKNTINNIIDNNYIIDIQEQDSAPSVSETFNETIAKNMLENSTILTSFNRKGIIPEINYDKIICGKNGIIIGYNDFKSSFGNYHNKDKKKKNENKLLKNYLLFRSFLEEFDKLIIKLFIHFYNLNIQLDFKDEENNNIKGIKDITCIYTFFEPITNKPYRFRENNILINGTNSEMTGFQYLITKINSDIYKNIDNFDNIENIDLIYDNDPLNKDSNKSSGKNNSETKDNSDKNKNNSQNNKSKDNVNNPNNNVIIDMIDESNKEQSFFTFSDLNKKADKEKILEFIKIVENNTYYNGSIKQLSNGWYAIIKSDNSLYLYDIYFNYMTDIKGFKGKIFNIIERITKENKENNLIEIIGCCQKEINSIKIYLNQLNSSIKSYPLEQELCYNCVEMKESNYFFLGENGIIQYPEFFRNYKKKNITLLPYFSYIKINENYCAFISNKILPKGEDKLIFYNYNTKKLSNEINNYSFALSPNGLALMQKNIIPKNIKNVSDKKKKKKRNKNNIIQNEIRMNKILICGCKKYCNNQRNGILIVNAELSNNKVISDPFFETYDFEVNCICPISKIENMNKNYENINEEYKKNIKIIDTDYFLVGGFDNEKGEGKIKLYKLLYDDNIVNTSIEFIQDIEFDEEFEGLNGAVSCIFQSKISGNIIINCYDEKMYLFTSPNIDYYLENEN